MPCWLYLDGFLNWSGYKTRSMFPDAEAKNTVITLSSLGNRGEFSVFMTAAVPSYHLADTFNGTQCFPMFIYDSPPKTPETGPASKAELFPSSTPTDLSARRNGITDQALAHFRAAYPGEAVSKEDIFYYVYGLLHSPDYRERYGDTLRKELPRVPLTRTAEAYRATMQAGRALSALHLDFEDQDGWPGVSVVGEPNADPVGFYRVTQIKFAGKRPKLDKTTIIYNSMISIVGIPLEAYQYIVNGKSATEWVMERQCVSTDKASGIVNDANDYANETMKDPAYPLKLLMSVITVSMKTLEIVQSLPKLEVIAAGSNARPRKPPTAQELRSGILAHWGDTAITSTTMKIVDFLLTLDADRRVAITFGDIAKWLGQKKLTSETLSALNILVGSEFSILRARGYFLGDNDERYEMTPEDFRQVFRSGSLKHPRTGEPVHDAARHVVPVFELNTDLSSVETQ
jgi:hypothetical protein